MGALTLPPPPSEWRTVKAIRVSFSPWHPAGDDRPSFFNSRVTRGDHEIPCRLLLRNLAEITMRPNNEPLPFLLPFADVKYYESHVSSLTPLATSIGETRDHSSSDEGDAEVFPLFFHPSFFCTGRMVFDELYPIFFFLSRFH